MRLLLELMISNVIPCLKLFVPGPPKTAAIYLETRVECLAISKLNAFSKDNFYSRYKSFTPDLSCNEV